VRLVLFQLRLAGVVRHRLTLVVDTAGAAVLAILVVAPEVQVETVMIGAAAGVAVAQAILPQLIQTSP
jgi:hypothetical protein